MHCSVAIMNKMEEKKCDAPTLEKSSISISPSVVWRITFPNVLGNVMYEVDIVVVLCGVVCRLALLLLVFFCLIEL